MHRAELPSGELGYGDAAGESVEAEVMIDAPMSTALYKKSQIKSWMVGPSGPFAARCFAGLMESTEAINELVVWGASNPVAS